MTAPLGPLLVLTDRTQCTRPLVDVVAAAVDGGARAVVLREKDLPDDDRLRLRDALLPLLDGGTLVLAGAALGGEAVHLSAEEPVPAPRPALLGRSCHSADEVAAASGCDWVTVSPVRLTASKPGYGPALGLAGLAACTGGPPVYALGGLGPQDAPGCRAAGAVGLAVMGAVMRAAHPDRVVVELLEALA
ncbi:MAG: thiamine monophosphate synthase [Frankiales bacterium]|nr:thiamine monophosphate synthase [Frankiales bacterium]